MPSCSFFPVIVAGRPAFRAWPGLLGILTLLSALRPLPAPAAPEGPVVFAELESRVGALGVRRVQLFVDGQDVTSQAELGSLRVAWRAPAKMAAGEHQARAVVVDALGNVIEKAWTFVIAAPVTPEVLLFLAKDLVVELDPLPRETLAGRIVLAGTTLPGAEVHVRVNGGAEERALASPSGRFTVSVELEAGANDVVARALRLDTFDDGPEARGRVIRVMPAPPVEPPADLGGGQVPDSLPHDRGDGRPPLEAGGDEPPHDGGGEHHDPPADTGGGRVPAGPRGERGDTAPPLEPGDDKPPHDGGGEPHDPPGDTGGGRVPDGPRQQRDGGAGGLEPRPVEEPGPHGEVVITKPDDGDELSQDHVTVLGLAPAGSSVTLYVNGAARGTDAANPAGHFTIPNVALDEARNELVAEALLPAGGKLRSEPVVVTVAGHGHGIAPPLQLLSPSRRSLIARGATQRVEGSAWEGAQVEVEVNGRLVARDVAGPSGHFAMDVPLEAGPNSMLVEAWDDSGRSARSGLLSVTRPAGARATRPPLDPGPVDLPRDSRGPLRKLPADIPLR